MSSLNIVNPRIFMSRHFRPLAASLWERSHQTLIFLGLYSTRQSVQSSDGNVSTRAHFQSQVIELAERRNLTPAQVLLKWGLQRGTSVIPKAYGLQHMVDNFAVQELPDLSAEDMLQINAAESGQGEVRYVNAANHWGFDIYNPGNPDASEEV